MSKLVKLLASLVLVAGLMTATPNAAQAYRHGGWHGGWHGWHGGWRVGWHGWRGGWRWHRWGWRGGWYGWRVGWGPRWGWRPYAFYPRVYAAGLHCRWVTVPVWRHHHRVWHHIRRCW